ncbi:nucleotide-binding domain-containing protein [Annulohypoxylon truncatum]|uniref:nucleotide-binding domain-containing protein n=1 Tax=Annulohypoxylon truncatum TaxID=327061 RepID=UPI0020082CE4|nr:nucleotide-binding domain-containing protein [Annulohypoxylon truncatum]KAI1205763.1 nucleotide-binding domain-containing protein [Annulohypoxylon truncatum]
MASITKSWLCATCRRKASTPLASRISSYSTSSRHDKPLRMAVVGSGPAGFYTAYRVMSKVPKTKVDMFEALPVPYGLVRFGVAPDHPEVKNCESKFEEVASSPDFTFIGNVAIGNAGGHFGGCTIPLASMMHHYDAVVFAYGASKDKQLGIPGESELKGIYSAREFVGWYNGLPEYAGLAPDLTKGDEAIIIGQGNVALDVARMLLEDVDVLRKSDITEMAIETLLKSRIKRVQIVGRRGPMQAAFTIKEIRELMKLPGVGFHEIDRSLIPEQISKLPRAQRRLMEILVKGSATPLDSASKKWSLDFCLSPIEFFGGPDGHVESTLFERTSLASPFDPSSSVVGTGEKIQAPSSVVFRSIGYKSVALPGFDEAGISFDDRRGIINNDGMGRVLQVQSDESGNEQKRSHVPGLYCAGWVKRGPTGVIASTMEDAFSTGDAMASDWNADIPFLEGESSSGWEALRAGVEFGKCRVIHWEDWQKINRAEKLRGGLAGKEREKFISTTEMLEAAS